MEVRPHRFATSDPASAEEFLRNRWRALEDVELGPRFSLEVQGVRAPTFRVERIAHTSSMSVTVTADGPVQVVEVLGGSLAYEEDGVATTLGPGDLVAFDAGSAPMTVSRQANVGVVLLDRGLLAEVAGVPAERLALARSTVSSADDAERWRAAVRRANREINEHLRHGVHSADEVARRLARAALGVFGVREQGAAGSTPDVDPSHPVAKAVAFIEAHATDPLRVGEIADAAETSVRALQQAFARHHDTSPTAYLRRVRLEGAHRDLASAEPDGDVTVAEVAARWGFSQAGRFAAHYRDAFGVLPSETLRSRPRTGAPQWSSSASSR
ncbi:AraC family transcriptional regulator [Nocardioides solisilvae]|uniref:AraC family transcriptional regulator n=1 Tax=Nocardioides solisilvae TaxID=1542435 RepID=UPI0019501504|nr:AraC family transcriptional regulator [Nocardioides solisilvae]